jgi:hypothetical protein
LGREAARERHVASQLRRGDAWGGRRRQLARREERRRGRRGRITRASRSSILSTPRRIMLRSRAVAPPHTPCCCSVARANSRHGRRTGHRAQIRRADVGSPWSGKNVLTERSLHDASSRHRTSSIRPAAHACIARSLAAPGPNRTNSKQSETT